jgi:hypothetical protein
MRKKRQEFLDLKQGGRFVHDYSKLFNHLSQYALYQVDTDDKKDRFMIDLSTKLQERMSLNTEGSFLEFVSNVIITDDAIRAHKEAKKRKVVAALFSSAPPRYQTVYHHGPPTCLISSCSTSVSSNSGFPTHLSASISRWHLGLYLHHRPCRACLRHRPMESPPVILASIVAARATSRNSARAQEERRSGPHHPSTTWSAEGGCCQDRPRQLHHYGRHSRG